MMKVLVPVDGSPSSTHAVEYVARLAKSGSSMELLLLNVQEPVDAWEVRRFLREEEIQKMQQDQGNAALRAARELLDRAGIRYAAEVIEGEVAETITRLAKERGCEKIIMGTRGHGAIENLLLGSTTTKVIHLTDLPVTLVK